MFYLFSFDEALLDDLHGADKAKLSVPYHEDVPIFTFPEPFPDLEVSLLYLLISRFRHFPMTTVRLDLIHFSMGRRMT